MSAREKIAQFFPGLTGYNVADEILADHARELAAAIRDEGEHGGYEYVSGWVWAADLIDPDQEAE